MSTNPKAVNPTSYPHIVKVDGICGGQAIIEGTRLAVWHIVGNYYKVGLSEIGRASCRERVYVLV